MPLCLAHPCPAMGGGALHCRVLAAIPKGTLPIVMQLESRFSDSCHGRSEGEFRVSQVSPSPPFETPGRIQIAGGGSRDRTERLSI